MKKEYIISLISNKILNMYYKEKMVFVYTKLILERITNNITYCIAIT